MPELIYLSVFVWYLAIGFGCVKVIRHCIEDVPWSLSLAWPLLMVICAVSDLDKIKEGRP